MKKIGSLFVIGCMLATVFMFGAFNADAMGYTKSTTSQKIYYISPTGSDSNPGTKNAPFKTLMKAQSVASPGDTVYIRGGVYDDFKIAKTDNRYKDIFNYVINIYKSGITYEAYPGDPRPVFDFKNVPTNKRVAAFFIKKGVTGVNFKGFDVTGIKVGDQKQSSAFRIRGQANFWNVSVHDNAAIGFYYINGSSGIVYDSDAYNNIGPTDRSAGNIDGFGGHGGSVVFINDRSWHNSDDGFDTIRANGPMIFDHDWSFNNRGNQNGVGDQNGFKVGGYAYDTTGIPNPVPVHTVEYCLSANNGGNNFYANHQPGQSANWINNTAYAGKGGYGADFNMLERVSPTNINNIPGYREVLHNNIAYMGTLTENDNTPPKNETNNSWTINGGLTITPQDFYSLDMSQLTAPRKPDGSLPDVTFMQPVPSSPLYKHGLGYLADKNDPVAALQQLVKVLAQYGWIDNHGIANSLEMKLKNHDLSAFIHEAKAQSNQHIDKGIAHVLVLQAKALINK